MEKVRIVVSDTNILIDLIRLEHLDVLFKLGWEVITTDLVINEISEDSQKIIIGEYVKKGALKVKVFTSIEMLDLTSYYLSISGSTNLTLQDCSVLRYSKEKNAVLLSGDKKLKAKAENDHITVRGIIYLFDEAVEQNILQKDEAANILEDLLMLNNRLPKSEIQQRISQWRKETI